MTWTPCESRPCAGAALPLWAPRVHEELKVGSRISVLAYTDTKSYGASSLYAASGVRFDADDVAITQTLAGHLAMVMTSERENDQLVRAVHGRTVIGQRRAA